MADLCSVKSFRRARRAALTAKRDRFPSASALASARDTVQSWWRQAWEADEALAGRFWLEVDAALPVAGGRQLEDVFAGLEWRRLRLRQDQQVQEWAGTCSAIEPGRRNEIKRSDASRPTGPTAGGPAETGRP